MAREKIVCTADTWVLVADGVTTGAIIIDKWQPSDYIYTWVVHSEAAPSDETTATAITKREMLISSASSIDIYVKCKLIVSDEYIDGSVFYDTAQVYGLVQGIYVNTKIEDNVTLLLDHFINRVLWYGKKAVQTETVWAEEFSLTPFRAISGDGDFGSDTNDEAQVIGTDDTPVFLGQTAFKLFRITIVHCSKESDPYSLRFVWSETTMADGIAADQYTSLTLTYDNFASVPFELIFPRLENGFKVWCQCKNANDNATIDFFVGAFGF
jgi:hypothetical protein